MRNIIFSFSRVWIYKRKLFTIYYVLVTSSRIIYYLYKLLNIWRGIAYLAYIRMMLESAATLNCWKLNLIHLNKWIKFINFVAYMHALVLYCRELHKCRLYKVLSQIHYSYFLMNRLSLLYVIWFVLLTKKIWQVVLLSRRIFSVGICIFNWYLVI